MQRKTDKYREFVDHPRYGRRPNTSGLNPSPMDAGVRLHWNTTTHIEIVTQYESILGKRWPFGDFSAYTSGTKRIPNTAVLADPSKQTRATIPVTHYFDLERRCRDCKRQFIFFAEEQKHWYEELGFGLESDCVRCTECRKKQQGVGRLRERYESLFHIEEKSEQQILELADCCLQLVEQSVFSQKRLEFARMLLNKIDADSDLRQRREYIDLVRRSRPVAKASTNNPSLDSDRSSDS
ncbi:MAG: zinc-ribbon domain-containing protein [Planctomycetales bacterium]|nr:zinc-ribbon domain-containing protein [Planctomycetales bacterium]